ncbi:hypothetical protein BD560DRAFT_46324 [Blakeslea trispora]|nr:hypothetical protein BD560DRAFT_46324 [Blakeslea trispora]
MSGKKSKSSKPVPQSTPAKKPQGKKGIVKNGNAGSGKNVEEKPVPQRSTIFGDWTGKTPVSLLHEHCQKSNWEKPEFEVNKRKDSYIGSVTLSQRNKKTAQMQTVVFTTPDDFRLPTSMEAKHLAATYALHRVKSHMPLHRALPPQHRDYWRSFDALKTAANAWQYEPDPFTAHAPINAPKKNRSLPSKEHAASAVPMPTAHMSNAKMDQVKTREPEMDEEMRKYWQSLPSVQMGSDNRELAERVIKWSKIAYQPLPKKHSKEERKRLIGELVRMGFRAAHADEALDYSVDTSSALDWLCKFRFLFLS